MTVTNHADSSPHSALDHQVHRTVRDEIQEDICFLQHRIPRHLGCGDIVSGIYLESPLLHTHRSELFDHVGEDEYLNYSSWYIPLIKFLLGCMS